MFNFVKQIKTAKNSIFYSLVKDKNESIIGFARRNYNSERIIKKVVLNDNFEIIEDNDVTLIGEDPRSFTFKNKIYVLDNYFNDMHLIDYEKLERIKVNISGKNICFIPHKNNLYFIHYMKPFTMYKFDIENHGITNVTTGNNQSNIDYEYRGSTHGYKISNSEDEYYGYGHRTYINNKNTLKHDVFKWTVKFICDESPIINYFDIEQPPNSKNLCDPTSVIEVNNKKYLVTAEADFPWGADQDYITNVYEILE